MTFGQMPDEVRELCEHSEQGLPSSGNGGAAGAPAGGGRGTSIQDVRAAELAGPVYTSVSQAQTQDLF